MHTFALTISRGGAVVARQAHNLEVIGSNPVSATKEKSNREIGCFFSSPLYLLKHVLIMINPKTLSRKKKYQYKRSTYNPTSCIYS